jgi:esterase/lipase
MKIKSFDIACTGYSVAADWYEGESSDEIVLSLIGWTASKSRYADIMEGVCNATGASGLVFDYTGHGDSDADVMETRPAQHFLEVICVFDWLKEKYPDAKITVMGSSYGGYMAAFLAVYREFNRLVLRAPAMYRPQDFYSLSKDVQGREWTDKYRNDAAAMAENPVLHRGAGFKGKTFVIVHENDEVCHEPSTDAYIKAFRADNWIAPSATHNIGKMSTEWLKTYQNYISEWIKSN